MKKTVREWLKELPKDVRDSALTNYDKAQNSRHKRDESIHLKTQKQALKMAFSWRDTKEGFKFWEGIYNGLP